MLREHCKVGMKVIFGRGNGEQTLGEVVKANPSKCKVKTLEERGNGRGSMVGTVWNVPYSLMKPADGVSLPDAPQDDPADLPMPYNEFMPYGDKCIMEAIVDCYTSLSPEYLTADGERPMREVARLAIKLNERLRHLFLALGRQVSEQVAFDWSDEQRKTAV
jgi:hypothetical protein